jgi:uncharacterized protein YegL
MGGEQILPFYIVCDESASMEYNGGIDAINEGIPELHSVIASDPLVDDKARICLIAFSDDAQVLLPLSHASDIEEMPGVTAQGATSYGSVFRLLKSQIGTDISLFKADGFKVLRPTVFFMSDGEPTDDWEQDHQALTDKSTNPHAPNIIAFGVDQCNHATIKEVATFAAMAMESGASAGTALKEVIRGIADSIVASASSSTPTLVIPEDIEGMISLPLDVMDDPSNP